MKNFLLGVMTTVLCLVLMGANYQDDGPTEYEYKLVRVESVLATREKNLNNAAAGGWKLSSTSWPRNGNVSGRWIYCFFEREKR